MAETGTQLGIEADAEIGRIVRARLVWMLQRVFGLMLLLWVLSPSVSNQVNVQEEVLLGFFMGGLYAVFLHYRLFIFYLFGKGIDTREQRNRLPDEYYFGKIKQELFKKVQN